MSSARSSRAPAFGVGTVLLVIALGLVLGVGSGVGPWQAAAQEGDEARLSAARERLEAIGDRLREAESHEEAAEQAAHDAESTLDEIEAIVNEVASDVERQRAAVRDARRRLDTVERDSAVLQATFEERIAKLYMQGPELTFELLLSSEGAEEAVARTVLLEQLTEGDQVDLERLEASRISVAAEQRLLAAEERVLEQRLDEQRVVLAEAETLRDERALAAADARARREGLARQHDDLESEEKRLEQLVIEQQREERQRRAAAARGAGVNGASSSGGADRGGAQGSSGYRWPMCAGVTSEYGPRWGRMHRGIDQGAASGSAIGAVASGRVIFAGWQGGYGNLVLIDHGGTVSAYAHQSGFAVGQGAQVSQGQTIGYVGSTGNSTGPHLHLEFRVDGSAVNPRQYLSGGPC